MGTKELAIVGEVDGIDVDVFGANRCGAVGIEADAVRDGSIEPVAAGPVPARRRNQRGMVSAEWAVGIIAAVALAGVLIAVITNGPVEDTLLKFVLKVIQSFSSRII